MNRQPIEILLLVADFLENRQASRLFRLNSKLWRNHLSKAGRLFLRYRGWRPSKIPRWPSEGQRLSYRGNFGLEEIEFYSEEDRKSFNKQWAKEFQQGIKKILWNFPATIENLDFPSSITKFLFGENFGRQAKILFLPEFIEELDFSDCSFDQFPIPKWPDRLNILRLPGTFNEELIDFPNSLKEIQFGRGFSLSLRPEEFPPNIEILRFLGGAMIFQPGKFPDSLKEIYLGNYEGSLKQLKFPDSLEILDLGNQYNRPLPSPLPSGLKTLNLGYSFDQAIVPGSLPSGLAKLEFGRIFSHSLIGGIPAEVEEIIGLPVTTGRPMIAEIFPQHLQSLSLLLLEEDYEYSIPPRLLPLSIRKFHLFSSIPHENIIFSSSSSSGHWNFLYMKGLEELLLDFPLKQPLMAGELPEGLRKLKLAPIYNHPILPGLLPNSLRTLEIGSSRLLSEDFNFPLKPGVFPRGLKSLSLPASFQQPIEDDVLPDSLEEILLSPQYTGFFPLSALPKQFDGHSLEDSRQEFQRAHRFSIDFPPSFIESYENSCGPEAAVRLKEMLAEGDFSLYDLRNCSIGENFFIAEPILFPEGGKEALSLSIKDSLLPAFIIERRFLNKFYSR